MRLVLIALAALTFAVSALDTPSVSVVTAIDVATEVDPEYGDYNVARAASFVNYGDRVFVIKGARVATAAVNGYPSFRADAFRWALSTLGGVRQTFGYFSVVGQAEEPTANTAAPEAANVTADIRGAWFGAADAADVIQELTSSGVVVGSYNLHHPLLQWDAPQLSQFTVNDATGTSRTIRTMTIGTADGVFALQTVYAEARFDWTTDDGDVLRLSPDSVARRVLIQWYNPGHVAASWTTGPSANTAGNANNVIRLVWHQARVVGFGVASETTTPDANDRVFQVADQLPYTAYWAWSSIANVTVGSTATVGAAGITWRAPTAAEQALWGQAWAVRVGVTTFNGARPENIVWAHTAGLRVYYEQLVTADFGSATRVVGPQTIVTRSYSVNDNSIAIRAGAVLTWPPVNPRFFAIAAARFDAQRTTNTVDASASLAIFVANTIGRVEFGMALVHAEARASLPDPSALDSVTAGDTQDPAVESALGTVEATYTASAIAGSWRLTGILCYRDNNGNNKFDAAEDDNLGYYLFNLFTPWKPPARQTVPVQDNEGNVLEATIFTYETVDEVFAMRTVYSPVPATVEGRPVTPDMMKFDVRINYFNNPLNVRTIASLGKLAYTNNAPPDSETGPIKLALCGGIAAAGGQFSGSAQSTRWFNPESPTYVQAEWDNAVQYRTTPNGAITSGTVYVELTDPRNSTDVENVFQAQIKAGWSVRAGCWTFPGTRPNDIFWDPEVGMTVDYAAASACDPSSGTCSCPLSQASCASGETFFASVCQCATQCPIKASDCGYTQVYVAAECRCSGAAIAVASLLLLIFAVFSLL